MNKQIIRHGEVIMKQVNSLPEGVKEVRSTKKEIVAHSETGHNHVLTSPKNFKVYSLNGDTYVEIPELSNLIHEKTGKEAHAPHKVSPGIYKIYVKKSYDYFSKKMLVVRD